MLRFWLSLAMILFFLSGGVWAALPAATSQPIVIGDSFTMQSAIMGGPREINIWVPPGYAESEQAYPVLYVIDGGLQQDFQHISGLAQLATINFNYAELIVVGIGTQNRLMELTFAPQDSRYTRNPPDSGGAAKFRQHIAEEVVPFIERHYRTGNRSALVGESLAGLFTTETFLRTPALFTDYIAVSPSLWWDDKALSKQAPELLDRHDDTPRRLYLTMADEGGTMQKGLDMIVEALRVKAPENLDWTYIDRSQTETHASIYHGAVLDALSVLFGLPQPEHKGPDPWYLIEGGQPESDQ